MAKALSFVELSHLLRRVFVRHGMSERNAAILARNCAAAERDGATGHGLIRVPQYLSTIASGWADGQAEPRLEEGRAAGVVAVDARNGFAQPALALAREPAIAKARSNGIALISIRDSHHLSALWLDVEPFAEEGLLALAFVNSLMRLVPWGGREPVFGTNPMAFAAPRADGPPVVFDQASSAIAFGEVAVAAKAGHALPPGAALDREGRPTTDAQAVVEGGALLPFGGHKGSAIALMIELLCAGLTGGNFSFEVDSTAYPGARTAKTGELLILIDPRAGGAGDFALRAERLLAKLAANGEARLPGARRQENRRRAQADGIAVSETMLESLYAHLRK